MKKIIFSILPLLFVAGCASVEEKVGPEVETPQEILIPANVVSAVVSRGDGMINSTLKSDLEAYFIRMDKNPSYPSNYAGLQRKEATVAADDPNKNVMSFTPAEYYRTQGVWTKLVGWYPRAGSWDATQGKVTFPDVDGSVDIMTTKLVEGNSANQFSAANGNGIVFSHALTQIAVYGYADSETAKNYWGGITDIEILDKLTDCVITLPAVSALNNTAPTVTFSASKGNLPLIKTDPADPTDELLGEDAGTVYGSSNARPLGVYESDTEKNEVLLGYAMFAPNANSTDMLELSISTSEGYTRIAEFESGLPAGTSHKITLKFTIHEIIPAVTIDDWIEGTNPDDIEM